MPDVTQGRRQRIRVLWLTKGLGPGGAERLLVSSAAIVDRDRFELRAAYLLPWKDHLVGRLAELGVPAACLDGRRELDPRWVGRLRDLVRAEDIDVVHVPSPLAAALARPARRLLPRRGLGERFRFLGYREDPIRVLVAADIFCLSSRLEGLPIALLEAMAAGLPVVATRVGGVPTVVTDGMEGRLVPAGDPSALAAAVAELLDPTLRAGAAAAAAERVRACGLDRALQRQH